ncbi:MAG: phospholipase [Porphyromonas sp.]|nr:phospholipase [Porphyromonas sp.]
MILLGIAVVTAILIGILLRSKPLSAEEQRQAEEERPEGCCGMHLTCIKDSLHSGVSTKIEYYDDEELDRYAGMDPNLYTAEDEELFRDVLYTLKQEDVPGWARSIQLRNIPFPSAIKDELFLIVNEMRDYSALEHSYSNPSA